MWPPGPASRPCGSWPGTAERGGSRRHTRPLTRSHALGFLFKPRPDTCPADGGVRRRRAAARGPAPAPRRPSLAAPAPGSARFPRCRRPPGARARRRPWPPARRSCAPGVEAGSHAPAPAWGRARAGAARLSAPANRGPRRPRGGGARRGAGGRREGGARVGPARRGGVSGAGLAAERGCGVGNSPEEPTAPPREPRLPGPGRGWGGRQGGRCAALGIRVSGRAAPRALFAAMKRPCEETTSESDLDETIDVGSENNYSGWARAPSPRRRGALCGTAPWASPGSFPRRPHEEGQVLPEKRWVVGARERAWSGAREVGSHSGGAAQRTGTPESAGVGRDCCPAVCTRPADKQVPATGDAPATEAA